MLTEVQFFIPLTANEDAEGRKNRFPPEHHDAFLLDILAVFDGATFLPGETDGVWVDRAGKVHRDRCRVLVIGVASVTASGADLRAVAGRAREWYDQDAILFRYLGVSEVYEG